LAVEEVVNFAEARSEAVQGAWVRHDGMAEGSYVSYAFAGLRINFQLSSSGWTPCNDDLAANWTICGPMVDALCVTTREQAERLAKRDEAIRSKWGNPSINWGRPAHAPVTRDKWGKPQ